MSNSNRQNKTLGSHGSMAAMEEAACMAIHGQLAHAIATRKHATLAVSGGSSPSGLYRCLSDTILDWEKVTVVLVDERWVDEDHPASNARMLRETLLQGMAAKATFIGLKTSHATPKDGVAALNQTLQSTLTLPLDVVVLGMGNDGHTASWFPHAKGLDAALHESGPAFAISAMRSEVTGDLTDRMTLGLQAIRDAGAIHLILSGEEKQHTWHTACEPGPVADMPIRAILDEPHTTLFAHFAPKDGES